MFSAVARELPETAECDLSGLVVDGQPVARATVVAWLNAAYQHAFEDEFEEQEDSPACTVDGLYTLLLFADAIDSTRPLLKACCSQLQCLELRAQLGQTCVALQTHGTGYALSAGRQLSCSSSFTEPFNPVDSTAAAASAEEQQGLTQQVAAQIEQLLWLAYRLQLEPLILHLQDFIRLQSPFSNSLLSNDVHAVFTARVSTAAGVAGLPMGMQMLLNTVLGESMCFKGYEDESGIKTLLLPRNLSQDQRQPLRFKAFVQRSSLPLPQGAVVPVELDLFGTSTIKLGASWLPVQLRIGHLG
eukprot:GHRQ01011187.1.p1 GENE.GHRQ01011187.1~~GHRQ01011187.1.p1  ORF type:complete len:301 (+),score=107.77 GHRQ01011187.1:274-1176(+)